MSPYPPKIQVWYIRIAIRLLSDAGRPLTSASLVVCAPSESLQYFCRSDAEVLGVHDIIAHTPPINLEADSNSSITTPRPVHRLVAHRPAPLGHPFVHLLFWMLCLSTGASRNSINGINVVIRRSTSITEDAAGVNYGADNG